MYVYGYVCVCGGLFCGSTTNTKPTLVLGMVGALTFIFTYPPPLPLPVPHTLLNLSLTTHTIFTLIPIFNPTPTHITQSLTRPYPYSP